MTAPTIPSGAVAAQQAVSQYSAKTSAVQGRTVAGLLKLWDSLGQYRDQQAQQFISQAAPTVNGAQQAIAALTAGYLNQANAHAGAGSQQTPTVLSGKQLAGIRGVDPTEVYRRPFVQLYWALSKGATFDDAKAAGRARLEHIAASDLQLAKTHQAIQTLGSNDKVVGYRRVLVGAQSCAMCIVASTQRYHKEQLMPIHPACDCGIAPIYGHMDPGRSINTAILTKSGAVDENGHLNPDHVEDAGDLLEDVHSVIHQATGTSDRGARLVDYRKFLVTHEHGEMGPILSLGKATG